VRRPGRRLGRLLRRDDRTGRRRAAAGQPARDHRRVRHHRHLPRHDRARRLPRHAGPVRLGGAHDGPRPVPAHPAGPRRPVAADLDQAAAAAGQRAVARGDLAGSSRAGRLLGQPGPRRRRHRRPGHAHRRLGRHVQGRHDVPVRGRHRAEAAGHGPVAARAPAPVRRRALRLGERDGGLVGRAPGPGPAPAAGPGAVLRPRSRLARCWLARCWLAWGGPVAAGGRRYAAAVPGRARPGTGAAGRAGPARLPRRRGGRRGRGHVGPVRHGKRLARGAERGRRQEPDLHQRAAARADPDRRASRGRALPGPAGRGRGGAAGGPAGHGRPGWPLDADHHRLAPAGTCRRRRSRPRWGRTGGDHARRGRVRRPGRGAAAAVRGLRRLSPHLAVGGQPGDPRLLRRGPSLGAAHTRVRSRGRPGRHPGAARGTGPRLGYRRRAAVSRGVRQGGGRGGGDVRRPVQPAPSVRHRDEPGRAVHRPGAAGPAGRRGADRPGRRRLAAPRRGTGGRGRAEHVVADDQPDAGPRHPGRRAALRAHLDQRR